MEMLLGFIVLLGCLFLGIKHGGIGLAVISGIGLTLYTFVFQKYHQLLKIMYSF